MKTLNKVYIIGIYVRPAVQNTNFYTNIHEILTSESEQTRPSSASGVKMGSSLQDNFKNDRKKTNAVTTVLSTA